MRSKERQIELLKDLIATAMGRGKEGESEWLEFKTNISESHASVTYEQKVRKIGKLLTSLRERNRIEIGEKRAWVLKK